MKNKIYYKAQDDVLITINSWKNYLQNEKRFSEHTVDAYMRDLSFFINYYAQKGNIVNLDFLSSIDIRDFRSFITHRAQKNIKKRVEKPLKIV